MNLIHNFGEVVTGCLVFIFVVFDALVADERAGIVRFIDSENALGLAGGLLRTLD